MQYRIRILITSFAVVLLCFVRLCNAQGADSLKVGSRISYDENTYCIIGANDFGPNKVGRMWIKFYDANKTSFLAPKKGDLVIGALIKKVIYKDADNVWIISRAGRLYDSAVLVEIPSMRIIRHYMGYSFEISPDKEHIAYVIPGAYQKKVFVMMDETMLYPVFRSGFSSGSGIGLNIPNGPSVSDVGSSSTVELSKLAVPMEWENNSELLFAVRSFKLNNVTRDSDGPVKSIFYALNKGEKQRWIFNKIHLDKGTGDLLYKSKLQLNDLKTSFSSRIESGSSIVQEKAVTTE